MRAALRVKAHPVDEAEHRLPRALELARHGDLRHAVGIDVARINALVADGREARPALAAAGYVFERAAGSGKDICYYPAGPEALVDEERRAPLRERPPADAEYALHARRERRGDARKLAVGGEGHHLDAARHLSRVVPNDIYLAPARSDEVRDGVFGIVGGRERRGLEISDGIDAEHAQLRGDAAGYDYIQPAVAVEIGVVDGGEARPLALEDESGLIDLVGVLFQDVELERIVARAGEKRHGFADAVAVEVPELDALAVVAAGGRGVDDARIQNALYRVLKLQILLRRARERKELLHARVEAARHRQRDEKAYRSYALFRACRSHSKYLCIVFYRLLYHISGRLDSVFSPLRIFLL